MSVHTFLWHDYETFGANPRSDRPAQFAAIRTDAELNEIGDPMMWYCLPTSDYLPDPVSCLITGITPQICLEKGLPEPEFARRIDAELGLPGTVGVGYNSIRFDDEFTRHLLWRSLRDPYAREWQNDCGRWDLLDVVRLVYALRPEGIAWPKKPDGSPSFKLEDLSRANGIAHISAHDALSDVRATIGLARLIKHVQPRLFDFALKLRDKRQVAQELGWPVDVGRAKPFLHVSGGYGVAHGNLALVWPLMTHPTNKNDVIVWDLRHDPRELQSLDAETLRRRWFGKKDQLLPGESRVPLHTVSMNKSPMVVGNVRVLSPAQAQRWQIDLVQSHDHARFAQALPDVTGLLAQVLVKPAPTSGDAEQDLYGGFVSREDRATLNRLLATPIDSSRWQTPTFEDERLDDLVFRYRARHHEATLTPEEQVRWAQTRAARLITGEGGSRTAQAMFDRIDELMEVAEDQGNGAHMAILDALYDYGQSITPDWSDA